MTKTRVWVSAGVLTTALLFATSASADIIGFNNGAGYTANGGATFAGGTLTVTDGATGEARSAFFNTPQSIAGGFSASFIYQATLPGGICFCDGSGFVLQNSGAGASALGFGGGDYGFGGIAPSAAIEFSPDNLGLSPGGPGTGLYTNGGTPQSTGNPLNGTAPVFLNSQDQILVTVTYSGGILSETLTDLSTSAFFAINYGAVDLPGIVGGPTAFVGFVGGTGGGSSMQQFSQFSFTETPEPSTFGLLGSAVAAGFWLVRRKRAKA